jgi:hypothetical protein
MIVLALLVSPAKSADTAVELTDIDGTVHTVMGENPSAKKASVLVFISSDCPIANSYQPELRRLREEFNPEEFAIILVHGNPKLQIDEARRHQNDYEIELPIVLDPDQAIARRFHATITPEAVVVDSKGETLYIGRIDDRNSTYGKRRQRANREDLRLALQSISAGEPVAVSKTTAIGCRIVFEK